LNFSYFKQKPENKTPQKSKASDSKFDYPSLAHLNKFFLGRHKSKAVQFFDGFEIDEKFNWAVVNTIVKNAIARNDAYSDIKILKKNGSQRWLSSANSGLRLLHGQILREIEDPKFFHPSAFAFIKGKSAINCAEVHQKANWLIKIDLVDFFHFIDERMVYRTFRSRGVHKFQSFVFSRLLTRSPKKEDLGYLSLPSRYKRNYWSPAKWSKVTGNHRLGYLPQGARTSGAVSNLVAYRLDQKISELATFNNLLYTRYADDLIISSELEFNRLFAESILKQASKILRSEGFQVNPMKTRIVPPGARMKVLGLLVGKPGLRLTRQFRASVDKQLYLIEKFGFLESQVGVTQDYEMNAANIANRLLGRLVWAHQVAPYWAESRIERLKFLYQESDD
jgi:RNA-directed DNA polymerase